MHDRSAKGRDRSDQTGALSCLCARALAARLAAEGFTRGQPVDVFALSATQRDALFMTRHHPLCAMPPVPLHPTADGHDPYAMVVAGMRVRLDVELSP